MTITFEPLHESHFPLLLKWLEASYVKNWWDQDVTYTMDLVREKYSSYVKGYKLVDGQPKPIQAFIIYRKQNPVGYIQIYNAHDFLKCKTLSGLPANLGAFDIFIGEESALQQGLGSKAILEFLKLHGSQYSHMFADPDSSNIAAIKAYEKAGFKKISEQKDTKEVWMIKDLSLRNDPLPLRNLNRLEEISNDLDYQFIEKLKQLPFIEEIWIFGSRARGDHRDKSDIDIAILCNNSTDKEWDQIIDIIEDSDTLLKIDCIKCDRNILSEKLYNNILKDRKVIYVKKQN